KQHRLEDLDCIANVHKTDVHTELIDGIGELDKKGAEWEPVLRDLGGLLLQNKPAELAAKRAALAKLATGDQLPLTRQIGDAALISGDGSVDRLWAEAESDPARLADLLLSVPLLRDTGLRSAVYPKVE